MSVRRASILPAPAFVPVLALAALLLAPAARLEAAAKPQAAARPAAARPETTPPPSATTLKASPTSAAWGTLVTLTATVKNGSAPVANGSVTFYDGTKAIGSAQVVTTASGGGVVGTATLKTLALPIGANSLTAKYSGANAASASAAATVTVTGKYPDTATLADSGIQGSYALVGTVFSGGPLSPVATGSIAFKDNSTNQTLGTVALDATTLTQGFVNRAPWRRSRGHRPRPWRT
jgi:hypothetical protein